MNKSSSSSSRGGSVRNNNNDNVAMDGGGIDDDENDDNNNNDDVIVYDYDEHDNNDEPDNSDTNDIMFDISKLPKEMRNILAGGVAGMVAKSVVAPFERIKILFQVSSAPFRFRGVPRIGWNIVQTEGIAALWKGNTATMIRVFPYAGIQFMVFDRIKNHFLKEHELHDNFILRRSDTAKLEQLGQTRPNKHGLTPLESLLGGMVAGATSVVATYPLDLTRAQLAVLFKKGKNNMKNHQTTTQQQPNTTTHNKGFWDVLTQNYKSRGFLGLFRGLTPTILGIIPYAGLAFSLNEQGKQKIQEMTGRDLKTTERMQCGACAGLFAQTLTYPLEVTRRRMQTIGVVPIYSSKNEGATVALGLSSNNNGGGAIQQQPKNNIATTVHQQPKAMGMFGTIRVLYKEQGVGGFFKGVSMNWVKGPLAFSISFTVFDSVQSMIETDEERCKRLNRITRRV